MSGENEITEAEHNKRMAEKRIISAWAENQWPVKMTEKLFELHGHWLDQDTQREFESQLDELTEDLHQMERQYETDNGGYDTDELKNLDVEESKEISEQLYHNTQEALDLFDQLYSRVQGQYDVESQLPDLIDDSVRNTFNELLGDIDLSEDNTRVSTSTEIDDQTLNEIYNEVESSIENNLENFVDQGTMDDIYDQLTELQNDVLEQGRETREHVTNENSDTRATVTSEHEQTREEIRGEFNELKGQLDGGEGDSEGSLLDPIYSWFGNIGSGSTDENYRGNLAKIGAAVAGTYLIAEQVHDRDELTNVTWGDGERGPRVSEGPYTTSWDDESISNWNSFVDRVPGEVDEIYIESATGQQYVVVENENNEASSVAYKELDLDKEEEASLETSDNYLEFFNMEE